MTPEPSQTVWQKYAALLSSPRFHQLVGILILQVMAHYYLDDDYIFNALSSLLLGSVTIGTVDSAAKKLAGQSNG